MSLIWRPYGFFFVFDLLGALSRTDGKAASSPAPRFISLVLAGRRASAGQTGLNIFAGTALINLTVFGPCQQDKLFWFSVAFAYQEAELNSSLKGSRCIFPELRVHLLRLSRPFLKHCP